MTPVDVLGWARIQLYMRGVRRLPRRLRRIAYYRLLRLHTYRGARRTLGVTAWGGSMWLKPGDYVDDYLLCDGVWEPHVIAQLEATLRGGGWFFDVGAHIGSCTLAAAKILGERGRVAAFEPTPDTFARLAENVKLNHATLVNLAVGATPGMVQLDGGDDHNSGRSRISAGAGQACAMTTLDGFWTSVGRPPVRLIKIDVEGFELDVLLGARELLATGPGLLLELTPVGEGDALPRAREVLRLVAAAGYEVARWVEGSGWIGGDVPLDRQWDLAMSVRSLA
jgi:FkbM family methyltransferase